MRSIIFLLLLLSISLLCCAKSITDKGSINRNVYTNPTLGLSWEFPSAWQAQANVPSDMKNATVLLQLLVNGPQSGESIVVVCVDPKAYDENVPPRLDDKVWTSISIPGNTTSTAGTVLFTLGSGIPIHRYDFRSIQDPARYLTFLSGPREDYGLNFILTANSTGSRRYDPQYLANKGPPGLAS